MKEIEFLENIALEINSIAELMFDDEYERAIYRLGQLQEEVSYRAYRINTENQEE
jgi:hypothetical protein